MGSRKISRSRLADPKTEWREEAGKKLQMGLHFLLLAPSDRLTEMPVVATHLSIKGPSLLSSFTLP